MPVDPPAAPVVPVVQDNRHLVDAPVNGSARAKDREAMRRLLAEAGFDHAAGSLATAVAVAVTSQAGRDYDDRLGEMADRVEATVLDALIHFARGEGWRPR